MAAAMSGWNRGLNYFTVLDQKGRMHPRKCYDLHRHFFFFRFHFIYCRELDSIRL